MSGLCDDGGLYKGFGILLQQAEAAVPGNAGNRSFCLLNTHPMKNLLYIWQEKLCGFQLGLSQAPAIPILFIYRSVVGKQQEIF